MNQLALPPAPAPVGAYIEAEDLGVTLGFARPRKARELAKKLLASGVILSDEILRPSGGDGPKLTDPRTEPVWLTLSGAIKLATRASTPEAAAWCAAKITELVHAQQRAKVLEGRIAVLEAQASAHTLAVDVITEIRALRASHDGMRLEVAAMRADAAAARGNAPPALPPAPTAPPPEPGPLFPPREDPYDVLYREIRPVMLDPYRLRGVIARDLLDVLPLRVKEGLGTLQKGDALTALQHVMITFKRRHLVREMGTHKGAKLWGLIT